MKRSYKSIKRTSIVLLALFTSFSMAKSPRAVVAKVQGNVFVTSNQQTKKLDAGSFIYDFDEIFTEVGAELVFKDYFDHEYHVSGSSYVSLLNKIVELKSGYLWVKSLEDTDDEFQIQTVNSTIAYDSGEFITSYDPENGKTQVLSIKGTHSFNNNVYEFMKEEVGPGRFSFIKEDYENGAPRVPTPISSSAYEAVTSLFPSVKPMGSRRLMAKAPKHKENIISQDMNRKSPKRSVASVTLREDMRVASKPGEIVVRQSHSVKVRRQIASVPIDSETSRSKKLEKMYQDKIKKLAATTPKKKARKKFVPNYSTKSGVKVKVYSPSYRVPASVDKKSSPTPKFRPPQASAAPKKAVVRNPASVPSPLDEELKQDVFESSLRREYIKQKKHSGAVNNLIQDLESYSQDYKEAY